MGVGAMIRGGRRALYRGTGLGCVWKRQVGGLEILVWWRKYRQSGSALVCQVVPGGGLEFSSVFGSVASGCLAVVASGGWYLVTSTSTLA